jgi:hypothetical protein
VFAGGGIGRATGGCFFAHAPIITVIRIARTNRLFACRLIAAILETFGTLETPEPSEP